MDLKDFFELDIPQTRKKKEMLAERLHPFFQWLKDTYITQQWDMDLPLARLHELYSAQATKPLSKVAMGKLLRELGIEPNTRRFDGKPQRCIAFKWDELRDAYEARGWVHEYDDVGLPDEQA